MDRLTRIAADRAMRVEMLAVRQRQRDNPK